MRQVLIVGYGSIGKRHAQNLISLGYQPVILTKYPDKNELITFIDNFDNCADVEYCIIATQTANHYKDFKKVIDSTECKNFLLEKPIDCNLKKAKNILNIAISNRIKVHVAYDMRFINVFEKIKTFLKTELENIRLVKIVAGQYLPEWRPSRDYRLSYSANKYMGGGVDLDLSHEIDYMLWLFGYPVKKILLCKKKISGLEIDSPDYFKGLYEYPRFIVDVELDYFRKLERSLRFMGENSELVFLDFINRRLFLHGKETKEGNLFNDTTYIDELKEFLNLKPYEKLCSIEEGIKVLEVIK
jgi:predicted dehydrogenase